ncbi:MULTISPECIES: SGNH/GDSL hydrolase family protein [unclassified Robiginitalea]|uniref:SGNH/GDSL hydrolase family protein n=1 Tax=Robiginitalea TaxID=252306 RepID=UPI00234A0482|nr:MULTISPECIES: SGNH/GDSL hydrolase family protein [unclassified Robiginitalea]MDC6354159.1 SGNH/GDSL hydrolase family protein [Robiginitalea sp. PM2]MDC6374426.1 SGNH/GDSL hydrolase family protein [Robiginitalea sp. SP8]
MKTRIPAALILFALFTIGNYQQAVAQDWADLEHFREANKALAPPAPGEDRVVFMGNSITIGWLHKVPEFFEGKPYVNRGISGQTTPQMLLRFRQDVLDLSPKVVVILAGTNDIAGNTGPMTLEQILDNLKSMAELALANGVEPVLSSVLPAYDYPWRPGLQPNIKIPKLNSMIKNYAALSGIVYLDYFSEMADSRNGLDNTLATDEVHPTEKGYRMMAPLAEAAIAKALAKRASR